VPTWGWICGGLIVAALLAWVVFRVVFYRKVFAAEHFVEVARGVLALKQAALASLIVSDEQEPRSPEDPRVLRTSAGLVILYTISAREPGRFVHHVSVSIAGGHTAHAVGQTFILFVTHLLGLPPDRLALGVSEAAVHHAEALLSEQEQSDFTSREIKAPTPEHLAAFHQQQVEVRKQLRWERLHVEHR
jgi:hypothetical protein